MSIRKLRESLAAHQWKTIVLDLLVVITSILLAFQIDDWAKQRGEFRMERAYLHRLKQDLQIEQNLMDAAIEYANSRIQAVRLLDRAVTDPAGTIDNLKSLPWALETATWRSFPQINAFVYSELLASGNLSLVRSDALRRLLAEHYTALRNYARVGLDMQAQSNHTHQYK